MHSVAPNKVEIPEKRSYRQEKGLRTPSDGAGAILEVATYVDEAHWYGPVISEKCVLGFGLFGT
ncbi:hypothetical protein PG993_009632 [Apiospora rasikravindrae]|uniref:Uncharacterized protein n=1 Tax=Apiospora rasikravindrae TaxID=990691 RepID=A0ABR1SJX2_9PEZI